MRPLLRRLGVTCCALLVLAACSDDGGDGDEEAGTTSTAAGATTTTTAAAPQTTVAPTTTREALPTSSSSSPPPTTGSAPADTSTALGPFLGQVDVIMDDAAEAWAIVDAARAAGEATFPDEGWAAADRVGAAFYGLATSLPHGLDPEVRTAAVRLIYDVGGHVAPFVFAPGFDFETWDPQWDDTRAAGAAAVPVSRDALVAAAEAHPTLADVAAASAAAAEDTVLEVVVIRSFGHNLATAPLPYAVRWLGELPPPPEESDVPFCANVPFEGEAFAGTVVDGVGGCAIVYYGTTNPDDYEDALQAFLDDPGAVGTAPGEIVTIVWDDASEAYAVYGSWE